MAKTQLLDLSKELLEHIAYQLDTQNCLRLMLTCKALHEVASAGPLHDTIALSYIRGLSYSIKRLHDHLVRSPSAAKWIREYNVYGISLLTDSDEVCSISYNIGLAVMLAKHMPNLRCLTFPPLPEESTTLFREEMFGILAEVRTLRQFHITNNHLGQRLVLDHLLPVLALPALQLLSLDGFDLCQEDTQNLPMCASLTDLTIGYGSTDAVGLAHLFARCSNVKSLTMTHMGDIRCRYAIQTISNYYPNLHSLCIAQNAEPSEEPPDTDWLAVFPLLRSLTAMGDVLHDTALLYLSPLADFVDLNYSLLSGAAIAYALMKWMQDPAIQYRRRMVLRSSMDGNLQSLIRVGHSVSKSSMSLIDQYRTTARTR